MKAEAIRPKTPLNLADARRVVGDFVEEYNTTRLHSAIGYVTPQDRLEGRHTQIWAERDRKLEVARAARRDPTGMRKTFAQCRAHCSPRYLGSTYGYSGRTAASSRVGKRSGTPWPDNEAV